MNFKKTISLFAAFAITMTLASSQVFAEDGFQNPFKENKEREKLVLEAIMNDTEIPPENEDVFANLASPMWICTDCDWFMPSVCAAEGRVHEVGTHKYGLLRDKTCTRTLLYSRGAYVCPTCYKVEQVGEHWCWDVHRDCGQGQKDVCPMEVS